MGLLVLSVSAQTATDSSAAQEQSKRISFSTIPNKKEESLQPYYNALNTSTYGEQRFSVFDQLAAHYTENGTGDSVLKYGNLYQKEVVNWDKPSNIKKNYATKANFWQASGSRINGLPDNALKWHIKGITNAREANNTTFEYKHKIGLGRIYIQKENYTKAIEVLQKAMDEFKEELPRPTNEALMQLGNAHLYKKHYAEAKTYYNQALKGSIQFNDLRQELLIKLKLGYLAELDMDYETAFNLYNTSRERARENGLNILYNEGSIRVGELLYKQGNYDAAIIALSTTYFNAIERENLHYQAQTIDIQRRIFSAKGDYQNAYALMTHLRSVENEIKTSQQQKISKELEVQYETLEKEKEILTLEEAQLKKEGELKRQRTIKYAFLIGFLVILIPVIALLYLYYQKIQAQSLLASQQEEINTQKVTSLKQEQELNLIKTSIAAQDEERKRIAQELHDSIGGNLAGIKLQLSSLKNDDDGIKNVSHQLDETYQLVRDISHTLIPKKFQENRFTALITSYAKSISDTGKMEISVHAHPEDEINAIPEVMGMELFKIVQELLTNTLKHANATTVDLHFNGFQDHLNMLFEDNGKGFDTTKVTTGIGFQNIRKRIENLKGRLHIDSVVDRGTVVSAEIPLKP